MKIAVLGGGNGSFAAAADFALAGHEVALVRRDRSDVDAHLAAGATITLIDGKGRRVVPISHVTGDLAAAVRGAELILCPTPAFAQEDLARRVAPLLEPGQVVYLPPGTFGSYIFAKAAHDVGRAKDVSFAETGTLPWLARKQGPYEVRISGRGVRLLFVPTSSARPVRRVRRGRTSILGQADNLRIRLAGERGLFSLAHGSLSEVVRSSDLGDLTGRIAHAMSAMSRDEGPLCYVEVGTGVNRALAQLEKPLDTNEFESRRLGVMRANPCVAAYAGVGAIGIAIVPQALLDGVTVGTCRGLALNGMTE